VEYEDIDEWEKESGRQILRMVLEGVNYEDVNNAITQLHNRLTEIVSITTEMDVFIRLLLNWYYNKTENNKKDEAKPEVINV
jgi:hypothetical protein